VFNYPHHVWGIPYPKNICTQTFSAINIAFPVTLFFGLAE